MRFPRRKLSPFKNCHNPSPLYLPPPYGRGEIKRGEGVMLEIV